MTIKAIIDESKPVAADKYTIFIYVYHNKKKKVIATPYKIEKENFEDGKVSKGRVNYEQINSYLKKRCLEIETEYLKNPSGTIEQFLGEEKPVNKTTLRQFVVDYQNYLASGIVLTGQGGKLSPGSVKAMKNKIGYLTKFFDKKEEYDFKDVDRDFFNEYVNYLRYDLDLRDSTISKSIKVFKQAMKFAARKKLHDNVEYQEFSVTASESEAIALSEAEIEQLFSVDLPKHLEAERDRFYVAYNFLLRFTDSIDIDKRDIIKDGNKLFLSTVPIKTLDRVIIPLLPRTNEILKKYGYKLPKTTNQESNWKIKEIAELAELKELVTITELRKGKLIKTQFRKCDLITTHTCRRSMATNLYLNGFDLKQIQLMGGWKSLTSLQRYLKVDKLDNAKKAAEHPFFNR